MATMPSKKRKYNARFPAGRIKKIMQTDEEVGKVAQAVPIIISRTLELFVESLLSKALQVTVNRNAKTLSPSHVKQCILAESRFDFLRDLVKNIPDVSAAEEKELMSGESSPTSSRFSEASTPSTCDAKVQTTPPPRERDDLTRSVSVDSDRHRPRAKPIDLTHAMLTNNPFTFPLTEPTEAMDLSKRHVRSANFYQETLPDDQHNSVIKPNPSYASPQPSTSYTTVTPVPPSPKTYGYHRTPVTPVTPVINIDFTKNPGIPEIKVLGAAAVDDPMKVKVCRQNSKAKIEFKKAKPIQPPFDIDSLNSGNLQIDEDYDT